ncbi:MAG: ABC transporter permease subunit [Candidatus Mcinerneyibacterium aminivorans]|jgi:osmoprotectant transport system permease protein|uniref:ABC transporter permease subunit n=1 Tax=Candidatus Mcinerneyibacterium aminivorans TaxID=2703815 RepID=A0A5D0MI36_9BACT|nr:MAG: ABC transporter permease subunit [Candidatus Mcinerneyibacterium aminivorans]
MKKHFNQNIDYILLLSFFIGSFAYFFLGYVTVRENRLSSGENLSILKVSPWNIIVFFELLLILFLSFFKNNKIASYITIFTGNIIFISVLSGVAHFSRNFITKDSLMRISLSGGAWMMLLAAYIVIFSVKKENFLKRWEKIIFPNLFLIVTSILLLNGFFDNLSIIQEFHIRKDKFLYEFFNHLSIAFYTVLMGTILGVSLGVLAYKKKKFKPAVLSFVGFFQTIPGLALFGLFIAPLAFLSYKYPFLRNIGIKGIGRTPALIGLTLYALLPMVRNTYEGLKNIDRSILKVGSGMGMNNIQIFFKIEIPLSVPVILSGLRISTIQAIGNTTLAALIGAGGLGTFVFQGIGQGAPDLIILGAIPIIALSLGADIILRMVKKIFTPQALKRSEGE